MEGRPAIARGDLYTKWKDRPFVEIRRGEVNTLLDTIADNHGLPQADAVLATISNICNWYATRNEHYATPIVNGMRRDKRKPDEKQRDRSLSDSEIKAVWHAYDELGGHYDGIIKLLLLTGQRREKVAAMKWSNVDLETGDWAIATEAREKGNAEKVKLPPLALKIIEAQPQIAANPFAFPGSLRGRRRRSQGRIAEQPSFNACSQRQDELRAKLPSDMPHWVPHDLRRTTTSLMARLGVADHIAERTTGHKLQGVQRIYNRHPY